MRYNQSFEIPELYGGGIITNYFCTSKCKHCLYRCSPNLPKNYIDPNFLKDVLSIITKKGNPILHIGGGEPFLRAKTLKEVIQIVIKHGLFLEYVETNSSWYNGKSQAISVLNSLKEAGLKSILVSISPFHVEHIPFSKTLGVMEAARDVGINIIPWIESFLNDIIKLDINSTHSLEEFQKVYGKRYLMDIVNRYWIHPGGRAIEFLSKLLPLTPLKEILKTSSCQQELENTTHFHIDLYGNYIPGLCSGLSIKVEDLTDKISKTKYPLLNLLYFRGIKGLYEFAKKECGFIEKKDRYLNKCHLCFEIRDFLRKEKNTNFSELNPSEFYF